MKKLITIAILLFAASFTWAQEDSIGAFYESRHPVSETSNIVVGSQPEITQFLTSYFEKVNTWLQADKASLALLYEKESLTGWHFLFQQKFQGLPVFDAEIKVNMVGQEEITSYYDLTFDSRGWEQFGLKETAQSTNWDQVLANANLPTGTVTEREVVVFYNPITEQPVTALQVFVRSTGDYTEYVIDPEGRILLERSRKSNFVKDTTISVQLFLPDPVTVSETEYGDQLSDFGDADYPYINNQLTEMKVTADFQNGQFRLDRPYLSMVFLEGDATEAPVKNHPNFEYTRGQAPFEIVHAYSHVVLFNEHLKDLGFANATDFKLRMDARGSNSDNSYFTNTTPPQLVLGLGNVDDAEDGQVVIHEYGHALAHWASPNSNVGNQRQSMEEGFCDFFAVSYQRRYSDYRWEKIFKWDSGEGTFWPGRNADTDKQFPDDYEKDDIYHSGEIWSSVLMEIYDIMGRKNADRLVTEFLFRLSKNMQYRDAAGELLDVSQLLYGRAYQEAVFDRLLVRGLLEEDIDTEIVGTEQIFRYNSSLVVFIDEVTPDATISIYDMQGKLIRQEKNLNTAIFQVPASWFPSSGVYIIRLKTNESEVVERFVKMNR